jgi:hypothetical protein
MTRRNGRQTLVRLYSNVISKEELLQSGTGGVISQVNDLKVLILADISRVSRA